MDGDPESWRPARGPAARRGPGTSPCRSIPTPAAAKTARRGFWNARRPNADTRRPAPRRPPSTNLARSTAAPTPFIKGAIIKKGRMGHQPRSGKTQRDGRARPPRNSSRNSSSARRNRVTGRETDRAHAAKHCVPPGSQEPITVSYYKRNGGRPKRLAGAAKAESSNSREKQKGRFWSCGAGESPAPQSTSLPQGGLTSVNANTAPRAIIMEAPVRGTVIIWPGGIVRRAVVIPRSVSRVISISVVAIPTIARGRVITRVSIPVSAVPANGCHCRNVSRWHRGDSGKRAAGRLIATDGCRAAKKRCH